MIDEEIMEKLEKNVNLRRFCSYLCTDKRKWEIIISLLPFGFIPLFLQFTPTSNYSPVFGCMLLLMTNFFDKIIYLLTNRLGKVSEDFTKEELELFEVAREMDNKIAENTIHVTDKKGFVAETRRNKIIVGEKYLKRLDYNGKKFVIGHELFHYRGKGESYSLLFVIGAAILFSGLISALNMNIITILIFSGALRLVRAFTDRSIETLADFQGVLLSNRDAAKLALEERYRLKPTKLFDSHPTLEIRKNNIDREFPKI